MVNINKAKKKAEKLLSGKKTATAMQRKLCFICHKHRTAKLIHIDTGLVMCSACYKGSVLSRMEKVSNKRKNEKS